MHTVRARVNMCDTNPAALLRAQNTCMSRPISYIHNMFSIFSFLYFLHFSFRFFSHFLLIIFSFFSIFFSVPFFSRFFCSFFYHYHVSHIFFISLPPPFLFFLTEIDFPQQKKVSNCVFAPKIDAFHICVRSRAPPRRKN